MASVTVDWTGVVPQMLQTTQPMIVKAFLDDTGQGFVSTTTGASATVINGRIEEFSLSTLNTGRWTIELRLFSPANPTGVLVRVDYQFSTSWMADAACANAAMAFGPAVNALIAQALNDEALPLLLRGAASGPAAPADAH